MNNILPALRLILTLAAWCVTQTASAVDTEVKFVVKEDKIPESLKILEAKTKEDQNTLKVWFLESQDFDLREKGLTIRLRSNLGKKDEVTIKLGGHSPSQTDFPEGKEGDDESKLEQDWVVGGSRTTSFSIIQKLDEGSISNVQNGTKKIYDLFSATQKKFLEKYGAGIKWESLLELGPIKVNKFKINSGDLALTVEYWLLPKAAGGSELLEVSTKSKKDQTPESIESSVVSSMKQWGIPREEVAESKSRSVVDLLLKGKK